MRGSVDFDFFFSKKIKLSTKKSIPSEYAYHGLSLDKISQTSISGSCAAFSGSHPVVRDSRS